MFITKEAELTGMQNASEAVAYTLKEMRNFTQPGMTTKQLDNYGAAILSDFGAKSAPFLTYGFPGWTCISVNNEFCHGIPSAYRILKEGDLVNIDNLRRWKKSLTTTIQMAKVPLHFLRHTFTGQELSLKLEI